MNKLTKVGLTALGTVLVSSMAHSADLGVTGGAAIHFNGEDNSNLGNGFTMDNAMTFSASVEQDNGWNVTMSQTIDGGVLDEMNIKIDTVDFGTVTFSGHGTLGAIGSWDDLTPTAKEEAHGVDVGGTQDGATNHVTENDSFHWDYNLATVDCLTQIGRASCRERV